MDAKQYGNGHTDHEAERFMRLSIAAELKLLADAERDQAARRARRKAEREALDRARAALQHELERPLCEGKP